MFENPRRGRQARNFITKVPKILDLKSSSEQIFSENWRWVPLIKLRGQHVAFYGSKRITIFRSVKINFTLAFIFSIQTGTVMLIHLCGSVNARTPSPFSLFTPVFKHLLLKPDPVPIVAILLHLVERPTHFNEIRGRWETKHFLTFLSIDLFMHETEHREI